MLLHTCHNWQILGTAGSQSEGSKNPELKTQGIHPGSNNPKGQVRVHSGRREEKVVSGLERSPELVWWSWGVEPSPGAQQGPYGGWPRATAGRWAEGPCTLPRATGGHRTPEQGGAPSNLYLEASLWPESDRAEGPQTRLLEPQSTQPRLGHGGQKRVSGLDRNWEVSMVAGGGHASKRTD